METVNKKMSHVVESAEFNRFGVISMIILIIGCIGGLTVGYGAVNEVWSLSLVVLPTMATLALLLAVAPMRLIIGFATLSVVLDLALILYLSL